MDRLITLTASDLRQRIRDKSVILFALVVPLALMGVFNFVFGTAEDLDLGAVTVAVAIPDDDPLAAAVTGSLGAIEEDSAGVAVTQLTVPADEVAAAVRDGRAGLGVVVPEGFTPATTAGEPVTVEVIEGAGTLEAGIVLTVLDRTLDSIGSQATVVRAAAAAGVPPELVEEVARQASEAGPVYSLSPGESAVEQLSPAGALVAGQAGLFLLFTVSFGVLGLIEERENGTLARLRSMPMPAWLIVAAKATVSVVLGVVATSVLLVAGGLMFDVDWGSPLPVALLILAVVLAATSVMFLVVRVARTAEQAGVVASIVAIVLGIAGGAFMPVSAAGPAGVLLDLNPVSAFMRGLGIAAGGGGLADIGVQVAIMLGFAVVMVVFSRIVPDRGVVA